MNGVHVLALVGGIGAAAVIFELVRRRLLREKYAALWFFLGVGIAVLGFLPGLLDRIANALGVADPPNLLFFVALLVLLLVVLQLTWEVSRLEEKSRTLAEEVAILRLELEQASGEERGDGDDAPGPTAVRRGKMGGGARGGP